MSARRPDALSSSGLDVVAVALVSEGVLPREGPRQLIGSARQAGLCALCSCPVGGAKFEYEVLTGDPPRALNFHVACYRAWVRACKALRGAVSDK